MVEDPDVANGAFENPLREDCTRDAASEYPITFDELDQALGEVQHQLEQRLNQFYERAWLQGGMENHLMDAMGGVFFAFNPTRLRDNDYIRDLDLDDDVWDAVRDAHQNMAAVFGFNVERPTSYADTFHDDFYPYYIRFPDNWLEAQYNSRIRMKYLLRHEMTPAEALDFWALEFGEASLSGTQERDRWHAFRDVGREAVNKTTRQAKEKLGNPEKSPHYEDQQINVTKVE